MWCLKTHIRNRYDPYLNRLLEQFPRVTHVQVSGAGGFAPVPLSNGEMHINLAGDAVEKWSCNFRRENRNICISTPDSRAKKDLWGSPTPRGLNPRVLNPFTFLLVFYCEE